MMTFGRRRTSVKAERWRGRDLEEGLERLKRNMQKFEQIRTKDQVGLLIRMLRMIAAGGCKTIQEFAETRGQTPFDVWPEVCLEEGLNECEPWNGYPTVSKEAIKNSPRDTQVWFKTIAGQDKN
jgi:hypothetical protein